MPLTILHVEDQQVVADAARHTLEAEGWRVVTCADGAAALSRLAGGTRYDLLLTDSKLPHASGPEVARYARRLKHLSGMPIVMLSAADCRGEALRAGVDVFRRKPGRRQRAGRHGRAATGSGREVGGRPVAGTSPRRRPEAVPRGAAAPGRGRGGLNCCAKPGYRVLGSDAVFQDGPRIAFAA